MTPDYPIYVPSKGRADTCHTARLFLAERTPFRLVVEPSQADEYARRFPDAELLVTPRDDMKLLGVRNWIRDHAEASGAARHWQIDDNVNRFRRAFKGRRIPIDPAAALHVCEVFTDRYTNIGVSGLNYTMNGNPLVTSHPYTINCHVYSISLINHAMPLRWRLVYNDDTDLCLQALSAGWCTVALNVMCADKLRTMTVGGGNTDQLYQDDGRLRMARALERQWPRTVTTHRRFGRAQHRVAKVWKQFDTPLARRDDIDWANLPAVDELGLTLRAVRPPTTAHTSELLAGWQVRETAQATGGSSDAAQ